VVLIIIYLLTRKKKPAPKAAEIDAYQEAKTQLARLEKEGPESKVFFTKLVDIFKWYLQRRTELVSVDQTTADLIDKLWSLKLTGQEELRQALLLSDFVKFAKYQPTDQERKVSFEVIKKSMEQIEEQFKQKDATAKHN